MNYYQAVKKAAKTSGKVWGKFPIGRLAHGWPAMWEAEEWTDDAPSNPLNGWIFWSYVDRN
jgi:hypothetical protein